MKMKGGKRDRPFISIGFGLNLHSCITCTWIHLLDSKEPLQKSLQLVDEVLKNLLIVGGICFVGVKSYLDMQLTIQKDN